MFTGRFYVVCRYVIVLPVCVCSCDDWVWVNALSCMFIGMVTSVENEVLTMAIFKISHT